mgnify:CR=1 FL=1
MVKQNSRSGEQKRRRTWVARSVKKNTKPKEDTDTTKKKRKREK